MHRGLLIWLLRATNCVYKIVVYLLRTVATMTLNRLMIALGLSSLSLLSALPAIAIELTAIGPGPMDTPFFYGQETPERVAFHNRKAWVIN